jgi:CRP/FNR family cyclic AMP-dependent transcriptional regulator
MDVTGAFGRIYDGGDYVFRQGEEGDKMYVIQEGSVEVVLEKDGAELQLAVLGPGEFFGEMAIFEKEVRMAGARAVGKARILTVDRKNFLMRIHEDPSLAFQIIHSMSRKIRDLGEELLELKKRR